MGGLIRGNPTPHEENTTGALDDVALTEGGLVYNFSSQIVKGAAGRLGLFVPVMNQVVFFSLCPHLT